MCGKHHSEETKQKISEARSGEKNPMYGRTGEKSPTYDVHRFGKDAPNYGKKHSTEAKQKMSEAKSGEKNPNYGCVGEKNPMYGLRGEKSPNYGKKHSPETRRIMSEALSGEKNPRFGKEPVYPRKWYTLLDGSEMLLRSTYEKRVLNVLIAQGVPWEYESCTYNMGNCTYHPDIYLPTFGIWLQPKGYPKLKAVDKMLKFNTLFPNDPERLMFKKDIDALEKAAYYGVSIDFTKVGTDARQGIINHAFAYKGNNDAEHWRNMNRLFLVALTPKSVCAIA